MITSFTDAFTAICGIEKGFSNIQTDPGNWTGGHVGIGELKGTKYGISAASYPDQDIENLTIDQAQLLAKRDYWDKYQCDQFDPSLGYLIFDAAYNGGHPAQWLQVAVNVTADGVIGAQTIAAIRSIDLWKIRDRFNALHARYYASLQNKDAIDGWMNRIAYNLELGAS